MTARPGPLRLLLLGANGQLGRELTRALQPLGDVTAITRADADLLDPVRLRTMLRRAHPDVIVNAAAYTDVERAEREEDVATAINADAPGVIADEAERLGATMVHFSTDYVFDGRATRPYTEDDAPNPVNAYGRTKLAGEQAVRAAVRRHVILRSSWMYGTHGQNFVRTVLELAHDRRELHVVADQVGTPTSSRSLAAATTRIIERVSGPDAGDPSEWAGTYHLSSRGETSWFGLAEAVLALDPRRRAQRCETVVPVRSDQEPQRAHRPAFSALDSSRAAARFGVRLGGWREELERVMEDL